MKHFLIVVMLCCLTSNASYAQKPATPCCDIIGMDNTKGIITSRNNTTGKVQQFKTTPAGMGRLQIGDRISVQSGKITGVNETGFEPVNGIIAQQLNDGEPCCTIVSLQVNDAEPCCDIVTVKNNTTGELHTFQAIKNIAHTLTLGQSVNMQNEYAMVQSGASASPVQKGLYAFPTGSANETTSTKENGKENSSAKWVTTPSGLKGATGNVTVSFPTGTTWNMLFKTTENRHIISVNNSKSHTMVPGQYNIDFSAVPVLGVPVQKGMNTRIKAGTLNVVSTGGWMLYDENQKINFVSYNYPMKLGLPIGKYAISASGQFLKVEIKDGEVTDF